MSNPLTLIREGVQDADWSKVCEAFSLLTGERLTPLDQAPQPSYNVAEVYLQKIAGLIDEYVNTDPASYCVPVEHGTVVPVEVDPLGSGLQVLLEDSQPTQLAAPVERPTPVEPEPDAASVRARQLRDADAGIAPLPEPEDPHAKFRVQNGTPPREDGKKVCKAVPFQADKAAVNRFEKDKHAANDLVLESKRLSETKTPEPRRPEVKNVKVHCGKCDKDFLVAPIFAPRNVDPKGADTSTYVCDGCIRKPGRV